ncbi:hypothetical protein FA15DRAFT_169163 [Coprinopsis marcescibilis]|uniref:DUF7918 domain-containing protein n=1 Tax=Coprinopsis marcescibilis TaxID=230819 RepID=A0A5C3L3M3_COPMA|nr:hypothetical protein FA15DRAFT_169163 [Coprinopsis marcescibilis]
MPQFGGFDVCLEMDDSKMVEFGTVIDEQKKEATCFVGCKEGKICLKPYGRRYNKGDRRTEVKLFEEVVSVDDTTDERRYFQFATVALTDDDAYMGVSNLESVGIIQVKVISVKEYILKPNPPALKVNSSGTGNQVMLHERSKKGISHCVGFGKGEKQPKVLYTQTAKPTGTVILGTFTFKYRTMDILVADGIAPRRVSQRNTELSKRESLEASPSTSRARPQTQEIIEIKEEEDDQASQEEKLEAQLKAIRDKRARSGNSLQGRSAKRVKREVKSEFGLFKPGEVIDLTI